MVARDDGTSDFPWGNFTHVKNDDGGHESDTETSDQTTGNNQAETARVGSLKDDTDNEDGTTTANGDFSTEEIGKVTGDNGTQKGTGRQDGGDQGNLPGGNDKSGALSVVSRWRNGKTGDSALEYC